MRKSPTNYSYEFKLSVIRDYYSSGMSKKACARKYGLCNETLLRSWIKRYCIEEKVVPLPVEPVEEDMANRSKEDYKEENAQLKKRIKELEKALDFSRLETLARDLMIDKAEEYFDIAIRKKSGARQP